MEKLKTCNVCGKSKPYSDFYPNYANKNRNPINPCKQCKQTTKRAQFTRTPESFIRRSVSVLRYSRSQEERRVRWCLTADQVIDLYYKQDGLCALTGLVMTHQRASDQRNPQNISIDRIDNQDIYRLENIHLVCKIINMARGSLSLEEFIQLCHSVSNHTTPPSLLDRCAQPVHPLDNQQSTA